MLSIEYMVSMNSLGPTRIFLKIVESGPRDTSSTVLKGVRVGRCVRDIQDDTKTVILLSSDHHSRSVIETEHVDPCFFIVIIQGSWIVPLNVLDEELAPRLRCLASESLFCR